jgi:hypothetical protein
MGNLNSRQQNSTQDTKWVPPFWVERYRQRKVQMDLLYTAFDRFDDLTLKLSMPATKTRKYSGLMAFLAEVCMLDQWREIKDKFLSIGWVKQVYIWWLKYSMSPAVEVVEKIVVTLLTGLIKVCLYLAEVADIFVTKRRLFIIFNKLKEWLQRELWAKIIFFVLVLMLVLVW